jgi:hypothetical protein
MLLLGNRFLEGLTQLLDHLSHPQSRLEGPCQCSKGVSSSNFFLHEHANAD